MSTSTRTSERLSAARERLLNAPGESARAHASALGAACARVIGSGQLILGPEVGAFEATLAEASDCRHAVGVANGTDALELCLRAVGAGPGDRVITVGHTAGATLRAILRTGATPLLVDIDPRTFLMNLEQARGALETAKNVRALLPVHIYGHPLDVGALRALADQFGVALVEDCAQAFGATFAGKAVGSSSDCAAFSFYPTKNLGALGDAGAALTNSDARAERLRQMREYGWKQRQDALDFGINSRLDELQAALLRVKLAAFAQEQQRREQIAARYHEALAGTDVALPSVQAGARHAWHLFVLRVRERDAVRSWLAKHGLPLPVHYLIPAHRQPAYAGVEVFEGPLTHTDLAAREILSLPLHPQLRDDDVDLVCEMLREALAQSA